MLLEVHPGCRPGGRGRRETAHKRLWHNPMEKLRPRTGMVEGSVGGEEEGQQGEVFRRQMKTGLGD